LRSGLAEINVPTVVQFKAHDAPRKAVHIKTTIRPLEAIRAVIEGGVESPARKLCPSVAGSARSGLR